MKETKKAIGKTAAKAAPVKEAVKAEAAKVESVVKPAAEKVESAVKTVAEKAAPVAKAAPAAKKAATAAKTAVKKTTKTAAKAVAKPAAKKTAVKETVTVQFDGKSYTSEDLVKIAKDVWKYDLEKNEKDFKSVELFVKPEESTVYYIINGDVLGSFKI